MVRDLGPYVSLVPCRQVTALPVATTRLPDAQHTASRAGHSLVRWYGPSFGLSTPVLHAVLRHYPQASGGQSKAGQAGHMHAVMTHRLLAGELERLAAGRRHRQPAGAASWRPLVLRVEARGPCCMLQPACRLARLARQWSPRSDTIKS